jgi:signal transduction histidine kinase
MIAGILVPRTLRLRMLLAYVGVFSATLLVFALAVHEAFAASLQAQVTSRLAALAGAGVTDVIFTPTSFHPAFRVDRILRGDEEGIEWFDARSARVAQIGLVPPSLDPPHPNQREPFRVDGRYLDTYSVVLRDRSGHVRGYVRAGAADTEYRATLKRLDVDIGLGSVFALVLSAFAGYVLSGQAAERTEVEMARLERFTADAAHELRGPLTAIASNVEATLRDRGSVSSRVRNRLLAVSDAAVQMRRLTDSLLLLARAGQPLERDLFVVDLTALITRVFALYDELARTRGVEVTCEPCKGVRAYGNPDQLQCIVSNLVENAIRYTPAGGRVTIACTVERAAVAIRVRDTGIGLSEDDRHKVFERFWRGDPARSDGRGVGLGLAVALALTERHGGSITVTSEVGRGSTFTLSLPHIAPPAPPSSDARTLPAAPTGAA